MSRSESWRRSVMRAASACLMMLTIVTTPCVAFGQADDRPNIILCMTDDQGWGDTGYNGHPHLKTPHLDTMAREGLRFNRFYSAAPVCSPTRGSCLTGRHPYRYRIRYANDGHIPSQETTIAEVLKSEGYTTGHFGKWHLGTLTITVEESNRGGPQGAEDYAPPWENGFDICFSTEAKVPTCNPMVDPATGEPYGTHYWTGRDEMVTDDLIGDDSRIIMDRAIPFIENAVREDTPFFAVIWFHAPHKPVLAGLEHRAHYDDLPEQAQHYLGCLTAMDVQIGRLHQTLDELGAAGNTMIWFCSDNGPEDKEYDGTNGSAGPLRGRKRSLFEGGIRVPGLLVWPEKIKQPRIVEIPCSTSDYFPTILDALGLNTNETSEPIDGVSLMLLINDELQARSQSICFESRKQIALVDNQYKLISTDDGATWMLFDLIADPAESRDLAPDMPELVEKYRSTLATWRASCVASRSGEDY